MFKKSFIPWSEQKTPPPTFLKKVKETQGERSKEFLDSILDQDLDSHFRPKIPFKCPKLAKLVNSQMTKKLNLQMATTSHNRETVNDNILLTIRNMEPQAPK